MPIKSMYMLLIYTVGTLTIGALFSTGAAAQQPNPPGSYQQSCKAIKAEGGKLTATCEPKKGGWDFLGLGGKPFVGQSTIENFFECEGDISNNNGTLSCTRHPNSLKLNNTKAAISSGLKVVYGITPTANIEWYYWLSRMFSEGGLQPKYFTNTGIVGSDAVAFFRKLFTRVNEHNLRKAVIDRAFTDVYSFKAKPTDLAFWNAILQKGDTGYTQIVAVERPKLNKDKVIRRLMIANAFKKGMGRMPNVGEFNYWQPRTETFSEVVTAIRDYLYSPAGAKDLAETVSRALQAKSGSPPKLDDIYTAISKYSQTKAIYDEM